MLNRSGDRFTFHWNNETGMIPLWAFMNVEIDLLAGFQSPVTLHLDCGVVSEDVFTAILRANEAKAFSIIEPFNSTRLHASTSLS